MTERTLYEVTVIRTMAYKMLIEAENEQTAKALGVWYEDSDDGTLIGECIDYGPVEARSVSRAKVKGLDIHETQEHADSAYEDWRDTAADLGYEASGEKDDIGNSADS